MTLLAVAVGIFVSAGVAALLTGRHPTWATRFGVGGALLGSAIGLAPAIAVLCGHGVSPVSLPWSVPGGALSLGIDPLSAFFLVPIFVVTAATAAYGGPYLTAEVGHKLVGPAWLFFDGLAASLVVVATARNGLLFLVAWEAMALTSYFLVVFHHEREGVPRAGWIYLAATHLGTAFLLVLFTLLAQHAGSFDFARWGRPASGAAGLFVLALVGFGAKAGFFPLHLWLPEAHPVAPSPVSALLSGVMVKMGLYGLLRILTILGPPSPAWGGVLLAVGVASGVYGALCALAQRDLKRILAYSTVENVGIIAIGLGLGLYAASVGATSVAALALAGALLHVWNHALFKSLLFLGAGSVGRAAGTLDLEHLGGQLRRMPWTGAAFALGAAAICALPPLNGFAGEFLIYLGSFRAVGGSQAGVGVGLAALVGLGLAGALAAVAFSRATGIAFLGEPRSGAAARAGEVGWGMRLPLLGLAAGCVLLGVAAPLGLASALRPVQELAGPTADVRMALASGAAALWRVGAAGGAVALAALALAALRRRALRTRSVRVAGTWDCGFEAPTTRMQYTASSFSQPFTRLLAPLLRIRTSGGRPEGAFPPPTSFSSRSGDVAGDLFAALFAAIEAAALWLRRLQAGSTQIYVLYTVLAALLLLLLWRLG